MGKEKQKKKRQKSKDSYLLTSGEGEAIASQTPAHLRGFLKTMSGGVTGDGLPGFDPLVGILEDRLEAIGPSPLIPPEIMDFYGKSMSDLLEERQKTGVIFYPF
jgi:hypothetical protein